MLDQKSKLRQSCEATAKTSLGVRAGVSFTYSLKIKLTKEPFFVHVVDDPPLTKQNGGLREIFAPVHTPKQKVRGGRRAWSKWKLRIENGIFATANYGNGFALSDFEFKVFTLEINFQFRIVTFGNLSSHI